MYPNEIIFGMDLYSILILVGCLSAIVYFRIVSDKIKMETNVYNLTILSGTLAIVGGYFSSVLFQALYNFLDTGVFEINNHTGSTFYGGLIGGAVVFLLCYFLIGHFTCKKKENIKQFRLMTDGAAAAISIAHALGRIGCAMAGCCYGKKTDSWIGIYNDYLGYKTIPVQLFESAFLFIMFGFFTYRLLKGKTYNLAIYMLSYGIWRFLIEYLRDDDRGATVVKFLTPSQLTALLMVIGGAALFFIMRYFVNKKPINKKPKEEIKEQ